MNEKGGIYAGTFDPIHQGHIDFLQAAIAELDLSMVYVIPEPHPRRKTNVTNIEHRLKMAELVFDDNPVIQITKISHDYASMPDTFNELGLSAPIYMLIGSDIAFSLKTWPNLGSLLAMCHFVIGVRNKNDQKRIHTLMAHIGVSTDDYTTIETATSHISSSQARENKSSFHPKLQNYIQKHHLYGV